MPKPNLVLLLALAGAMVLGVVPGLAQAAQNTPADATTKPNAASDQDIQLLRQDIRAQRKQLTAANMVLTPDEATKFWPIYDQYIQETIKINDLRWNLIKEYAASYNTMTAAQAKDLMKNSADVDQQFIALRLKYVPIFEKVISSKKTALWYQIDRRIELMINLQLDSRIPVINAGQ